MLIFFLGASAQTGILADTTGSGDGPVPQSLSADANRTYQPAEILSMDPIITASYADNIQYNRVDWSPDGKYLAQCGRLWNGQDRLVIFTPNGMVLDTVTSIVPHIEAYIVAWSPDGDHIALGGWYGYGDNIRVYSFDGTALALVDSAKHTSWVYSISWTPDGDHLAICGNLGLDDVYLYSFDGSSLSLVDSIDVLSYGRQLEWGANGEYLAVAGSLMTSEYVYVGKVVIISVDNGTLIEETHLDFGGSAYSVGWSPDGSYLGVGGDNGTTDVVIYERSIVQGNISFDERDSMDYGYQTNQILWSPAGGHLLVAGESRSTWDVGLFTFDGTYLGDKFKYRFGDRANSASWSPDGMYIAVSGSNGATDIIVYEIGYGGLTFPDEVEGAEDTELMIDVLANDRTISGNPTIGNVTSTANGTIGISGDGRYVLYNPMSEWSGNDSFMYSHSEAEDDIPTVLVNITIRPVNDVPEITTEDVDVAMEDEPYSVSYDAVDRDGDAVLTWSGDTNAGWLSFDPATRELAGVPLNGDVGSYWVDISVTDTNGTTGSSNFTLVVENVNDDPVILTEDVVIAYEDSQYDVRYAAEDVDPTGDVFEWSMVSDATWLSMDGDHLVGVPDNDDVGEWSVNVTVSDGNGGSTATEFTLTVVNTNDAPWITTVPLEAATEDVEHNQTFEAGDVDVGDELTWSIEGPAWLTIGSTTGILSGTPANDDVGVQWIVVKISDGVAEDLISFMLTVENVNDAPHWVSTPDDEEIMENDLMFLEVYAEDDDKDAVTYGLSSTPTSGMTITPRTGAIRWMGAMPGTYAVEVTATDGTETIAHEFTVTVEEEPEPPANKVPVIQDMGDLNVTAGEPFMLILVGSDGDEWDARNLTFTLVSGPDSMVVSSDGVVYWLPGEDTVGVRTVMVELTDGKDKATLDFEVEVLEAVVDDGKTSGVEDGGDYMWLVIALVVVVLLLVVIMLWMYMGQREPPMVDMAQKDVEVEDDDLEVDEPEDTG